MLTRLRKGKSLTALLRKHFGNVAHDKLEVHTREFPRRVSVDAYRALDEWISQNCRKLAVLGVPVVDSFMSSVSLANLLAATEEPMAPTALKFDSIEIGEEEPASCVKHGLWLLEGAGGRLAVFWTSATVQSGCGFETKLRVDVAHPAGEKTTRNPASCSAAWSRPSSGRRPIAARSSRSRRTTATRATAAGITVHKLRSGRPRQRDPARDDAAACWTAT